MDLGLRGKSALVCVSSKGLGRGCAFSLARSGLTGFVTGQNFLIDGGSYPGTY